MAGLQAPRALPALACVLLALLPGPAVADGIGQIGGAPAAYRRLFQAPPPTADMEVTEQEANAIKDAVNSAGGQAGPYTEWVVPCEPERSRCPSLFLASWGYQCTTLDGDSCCLQPNGKFCTRLERWQGIAVPASWRGWDNATSTAAATSSGRVEAQQQQGGGNSSSTTMLNQRAGKPRKEGKTKEGEEEQDSGKPRKEGKAKEEEEQDSGKPWRIATATHFTSYPPCCENRKADRTECDKFNGCEWAGQFAGVSGKKSRSWIRERNIVAVFEAGRSKEWGKRWKGKTLRIKNPKTDNTLEVQVLDTCADSDCDGCCTTNARKNGGVLIDLESATAERFWEGEVQDLAAIEWQVV